MKLFNIYCEGEFMAVLEACPTCGNQTSENAASCPACGEPLLSGWALERRYDRDEGAAKMRPVRSGSSAPGV